MLRGCLTPFDEVMFADRYDLDALVSHFAYFGNKTIRGVLVLSA
jgi:hypothetical protein